MDNKPQIRSINRRNLTELKSWDDEMIYNWNMLGTLGTLRTITVVTMFDNKPGTNWSFSLPIKVRPSVVLVNFHFSILVTNHPSHQNPNFNKWYGKLNDKPGGILLGWSCYLLSFLLVQKWGWVNKITRVVGRGLGWQQLGSIPTILIFIPTKSHQDV